MFLGVSPVVTEDRKFYRRFNFTNLKIIFTFAKMSWSAKTLMCFKAVFSVVAVLVIKMWYRFTENVCVDEFM